MKNLNPKIIIFDFDGIIIDSNHKKECALIKSISDSYQIDYNEVKDYIENNPGKNREHYLKYFLDNSVDKEYLYSKAAKLFSDYVKEIYLNADIENDLINLKNHFPESQWFIVSSADRNEIIEILEHRNILYLFCNVYGGPKTKYENYIRYISNLAQSNKDVLHIGDGNQDIKLIQEANINGLLLTKWSMEPNFLLTYKNSNNIFVYHSLQDFISNL